MKLQTRTKYTKRNHFISLFNIIFISLFEKYIQMRNPSFLFSEKQSDLISETLLNTINIYFVFYHFDFYTVNALLQ